MNCPISRLTSSYGIPQGIVDVLDGTIGFTALFHNFTSIETGALSILTNLLLTFLEDLAIRSLSYAETANRTKILLSDVVLSLIDLGFDLRHLNELPRKRQYKGFKDPGAIGESKQQIQAKKSIFSSLVLSPTGSVVIPKSSSLRADGAPVPGNLFNPLAPTHLLLPAIPEAHTYLNTKVKRPPPGTDPILLRRKVIEQYRKIQLSLSKFLSRISPVFHLFPDDSEPFSILLPKPVKRPYVTALNADLDHNSEDQIQETEGQIPKKVLKATRALPDETSLRENFYLHDPRFPSAD